MGKRLVTLLITMGIVSFLAFAAFDFIGGDVATTMLGTQATPEAVALLRTELGLDDPFLVRYGAWLAGFFTGELGVSIQYGQSVSSLLAGKLTLTLHLVMLSFVMIVLCALPVALLSVRMEARKGFGWRIIRGVELTMTQLAMSLPPFFVGLVITWVFSVVLRWFMAGSLPALDTDPSGYWYYLLFPAVTLAIPRIAMTARMLRATLVEQMNQDYVRTAISRGAGINRVLSRHVLPNALPPVISFLAQTMAELVAAGIVVEQVFALPGLGRILLSSISNRDYPVVQAVVVMLALWVVVMGVLADIINSRIDPRLRLGGEAS